MTTPAEMLRRSLNRVTHRMHSLPVLVLMPHSRCNCRCVMCDIWKANRSGRELTAQDLSRHLHSVKRLRVQRVVLSGGEALMHTNLWALCALLADAQVRITLLSSGLLLARHAEDIVRWCDEVTVSLDGSRAVHDRIRNVPRAFDRLAEGVAALKERDPVLPVTARCVVQRRNFEHLPDIVGAAEAIGLDRISFLAADVSTPAFNRPSGWPEERVEDVALAPDDVRVFAQVVEELIATRADAFASGFIAETPERLRCLPRYYGALHGKNAFPMPDCNAPWVSAVVEAGGDVRPCFFHEPYGNLRDGELEEVLNGEAAVDFRRRLDVQRDATCRRCVCTLKVSAAKGV